MNISELVGMITLVNSHTTDAMVAACKVARVGCTGCYMDAFDRALSGERRVADVSEAPGPGVNPKAMRSSDDDAETALHTPMKTEDAGSADTNEAVKLVPEGVDTAHASTSLVAGEPSVTPHQKRSPPSGSELEGFGRELDGSKEAFAKPEPAAMDTKESQPKTRVSYTRKHHKRSPPSGSELDGFGSELDGSGKTRVGYTRKDKKHNLAWRRKNTVPVHAKKRAYQCVAGRQAYKHAKAIGKGDVAARAHAWLAYKRAAEEFDDLDTIFGFRMSGERREPLCAVGWC